MENRILLFYEIKKLFTCASDDTFEKLLFWSGGNL